MDLSYCDVVYRGSMEREREREMELVAVDGKDTVDVVVAAVMIVVNG